MIWDLVTDEKVGPLPNSNSEYPHLTSSPDGRYISYILSSRPIYPDGRLAYGDSPDILSIYDIETATSLTVMDMTAFEDTQHALCQSRCIYRIGSNFWSADSQILYYKIEGQGEESG